MQRLVDEGKLRRRSSAITTEKVESLLYSRFLIVEFRSSSSDWRKLVQGVKDETANFG